MDLMQIAESTIKVILILSMPSLIVSMIVGLIISVFQAVTQVNDASLSFVPKMIFVSIFILITLPWVGDNIISYTRNLWDIMLTFGAN